MQTVLSHNNIVVTARSRLLLAVADRP